jgi:ABC-type sugar transport system substrate-binding protein
MACGNFIGGGGTYAVTRPKAAKLLSVDPAITMIFSCNNEMLRGVRQLAL